MPQELNSNSSNNSNTQDNNTSDYNSNPVNLDIQWPRVDTSTSVTAQRSEIQKGSVDYFISKIER